MTATSATTRLRCFLALGSAFTSALCLGAGGAPPVAGDVALEYRVPPGCPGEAAFRERAADVFDFRDPFVPAGTRASSTLRIEITPEAKGFRGTLAHLGADGSARASTQERHDNCDALVFMLAHRVRLALGSAPVAPSAPPPAPAPDPGGEALWRRLDRLEETNEAQDVKIAAQDAKIAAQSAWIAKLQRDLEDEKKMDLTYTLSAGVLMTANLTSNVGPGVWMAGDLRSGPLVLGLDLRAVLPSRVAVGPFDRDVSQLTALLTPCGRYSIFFGCAVAGAGVQIDHDADYPSDTPTFFSPLVQLGARVGVEVPLGESRFALRGWGEVLYTTPSLEYGYVDEGAYADRPDVSGFFGLGLVVKFGKEGEK